MVPLIYAWRPIILYPKKKHRSPQKRDKTKSLMAKTTPEKKPRKSRNDRGAATQTPHPHPAPACPLHYINNKQQKQNMNNKT